MQSNRHRQGEARLADDDRDLIAQALAAAKNHELAVRRAFQRRRRAANDAQGSRAGHAIAAQIAQGDRQQTRQQRLDSRRRQDHGCRQNERKAHEFNRAVINRRQGGRRRVDTRFRVEQEGVNAFDLDLRQSDEARVRPVESELPQYRARKAPGGRSLAPPIQPRRILASSASTPTATIRVAPSWRTTGLPARISPTARSTSTTPTV